MSSLFSRWFGRKGKSLPIDAEWLVDNFGTSKAIFKADFDREGRLTYFGIGEKQCISLDPSLCQAERTYDQFSETYSQGEATSYDSWSDNVPPIRVEFWFWAELRILQIYRTYLINGGPGDYQPRAKTGDVSEWAKDYDTLLARVESEIEKRQARLPGGPNGLDRLRTALLRYADSAEPQEDSAEPEFRCSFCGKTRGEVQNFVSGPRVFICNECVKLATETIAMQPESEPDESAPAGTSDANLQDDEGSFADASVMHCSFCGKSHREVQAMIAGPSVYICDECIGLCIDIIAEEAGTDESS